MKRESLLSAWAAFGLAFALGASPAALAQEEEAQDPQQELQAEPQEFDEGTIDSFVVAALRVQEINDEAQANLLSAESAEEQVEIRDEATNQMIDAIEEEGLTLEEYNEVAVAAQQDADLANDIDLKVREAQDAEAAEDGAEGEGQAAEEGGGLPEEDLE